MKSWRLLVGSFLAAAAIFAGVQLTSSRPSVRTCTFTALDVGQGDALLIQTPDGQDMLVDGGPSQRVVSKVTRYLPPGDDAIELVVLTHPDADHLTGLLSIVERLTVRSLLVSQVTADTQTWHHWNALLAEHNLEPHTVHAGDQFQLGQYLMMQIIWPPANEPQKATNDLSVGIKLRCQGSTALMIGDASAEVEERLQQSGQDLHVALLKVSHHGSKYSSTHEFLQAVHPAVAVISVGRKNRYNHPHPATMIRLERAGITVWRTDLLGDVRLHSDGHGGWRKGG